jgi:hypothetical protein
LPVVALQTSGSFAFEIVSAAWFFLRDTFTASAAASPPAEIVLANAIPRVAKQNGHIVHLSGGEVLIVKPLLSR